jgi:molecular chaperone DnaK
MSGRLGIDFGTSNTVLALWDPATRQGSPLHIPDYGYAWEQNGETASIIPSLIHYAQDGRIWIGSQVRQQQVENSPRTFRWMKRYINQRSPYRLRLEERELTAYQAGQDFLNAILVFAAQEIDFGDEEIALSVPVEAFEHYEEWLTAAASQAGMPRFRLIDEPSAAALGYGAHIQPGNVYLIFDFGGGTMHASVILIEAEESAQTGRRCRVLGKAGRDIGGASIDQWLFQEVLRRNARADSEAFVRRLSTDLLLQCQHAKEDLTINPSAVIHASDPETGAALHAEVTRAEFEDMLDRHDFYGEINLLIRQALNAAAERGYREEDIQTALMVGGSSQIPSVQRTLRQIFGRERVLANRPLDAVARGAAAFAAGVDFYDHIQHNYAIRYLDPQTGQYAYRTIVERGTAYPTPAPVSHLAIKASYPNQENLGVAIFEVAASQGTKNTVIELVFDPSGAARITQITPHELEQRRLFWMNEHNPTFLVASPPARQGEARFEVEFSVDFNKRLTLTARDLLNGELTLKDYPVVKLT